MDERRIDESDRWKRPNMMPRSPMATLEHYAAMAFLARQERLADEATSAEELGSSGGAGGRRSG
jgi:hypothetical protein